MIEREFRVADVRRMVELQDQLFPEENGLYGIRSAELEKFASRLGRPGTRLALGLARALGRPLLVFRVIEEDGRLVATTLLTFGTRSGYVSFVMVDPAHRRKGFARRLVESARTSTRRRGKPYVVLDVLSENTAARTLYEALGYRSLRTVRALVRDAPFEEAAPAPPDVVRPFARPDERRLLALASARLAPAVAEVLPPGRSDLGGGGWAARAFASESGSWVVDAGGGPEAFVAATITPMTSAAHLSPLLVAPGTDPTRVAALIGRALAWAGARHAPRVVTLVPEENVPAREALRAAGFRDALTLETLYRSSA